MSKSHLQHITDSDLYWVRDGKPLLMAGTFKTFEIPMPKPILTKHGGIGARLQGEYPSRGAIEALSGKATAEIVEPALLSSLQNHPKMHAFQSRSFVDAYDEDGFSEEASKVMVTHLKGYFYLDGNFKIENAKPVEISFSYSIHEISQGYDGQKPWFDYHVGRNDTKANGQQIW